MVALNKAAVSSLIVCLLLAGCGGKALRWESRVHVVRAGETLSSIAFRYGLHEADLATWNRLDNPNLIFAGQKLRLTAPPGDRPVVATATPQRDSTSSRRIKNKTPTSAPEVSPPWRWPADGALLARFGDPSSVGQGIDIGGNKGDFVLAAAAGTVVYSGSGLLGYGKLVIVKHNEVYLSAYGHNASLLVKEGDSVTAGQRIARMGTGSGDRVLLHFEIRRKGQPVDPMQHLPSR